MENKDENNLDNSNGSEQSKKIVNNFKNELEKLKQKLNKDFYKYSKLEKDKEKITNFHYMNNNKNEPNKNENNYNELKNDIKTATDSIDNIINKTETKDEKTTITTKTNSNNSIFTKIPTLDELRMKYGINLNNKPSSIKDITIETNFNKFNKKKNISNLKKNFITENNENNDIKKENNLIQNTDINKNEICNKEQINNDIDSNSDSDDSKKNNLNINNENNKIEEINLNKKFGDISNIVNNDINNNEEDNHIKNEENKYDYINLVNLKRDAEEEIKNIFNKRDILDLSDNSDNEDIKDNINEEIFFNNENKEYQKDNIINKEEEKIQFTNNYVNDNKNKEPENINQNEIKGNNINFNIFKNYMNNLNNNNNEVNLVNNDNNEVNLLNNNDNSNINNEHNNINLGNNNDNEVDNNINYLSHINNIINNNQENKKKLVIEITEQLDKNDLKDIRDLPLKKEINTNIPKEKDENIIFKTNINAFDNNNLNIENEEKSRFITSESPIKAVLNNNININNNNNNTSIVDTSMLNSKLDQQIKLINEKSDINRMEEEKNLLKLKEIENSLQLDKRLTHNNREIRKNAIKELCEMCTNFNSDEDDKAKAFECFSPWVKYCLEETNSYVIPESLNFFILFNSLFPNFLSSSMKDFFDNIERYVNFGISSINENCFKIIFLIFQDKKLYNQSLNEIFKLLNTSYIKMVKFLNSLFLAMIENNIIMENYVKILFEKLINIYVKMGTKINEKKKIYSKLLIYIYNNIEDDYNGIKNNVKLASNKEIENMFIKIKKNKKKYKYRLYPKTENMNVENESQVVNNMNNNYNEKNKRNKTPERRNKDDNKDKGNLNNLILNNNSPDVNDIISILPNEFFEYHFLTQFQAKIKLLENTNNILNKIKNIRDKERNLIDVYKTINYSIEDSNILIHLEGIKLLENICRLVKNFINIQKLKLLLETCFDKLKDKKSLVKNELFTLFNNIIENHCFEIDKFILFILQFCTNQKKENAQVKMGLLEYVKLLFLQQNNILCFEVKKIKEKDYYNFIKKVVVIIQKESLSSIKDLCSDLLIIFKRRVENIDMFYDLISELPNYRKKIINEESVGGAEEGEYKKNLKRIKSSYSFSKTKYTGGFRSNNNKGEVRHERSKSNVRMNNFKRNKSTTNINASFSSGKNIKIKNNIIKKNVNNDGYKSKNNTRSNFRNNPKSQTGGLAKFNPNKIPSGLNNHNPPLTSNKKNKYTSNNIKNKNNSSKTKNSNYSPGNNNDNDDNGKEIEDNNIENNYNENDYYNELNTNSNNIQNNNNNKNYNQKEIKNNKEEDFSQKQENLLENIHNLDINSIDKYSKIIIRDFIIFVNKICNDNTQKEDLSYHFNILFTIFEKILYRLIVLLNENKEIKENYTKLKKLLDVLIGYISKIIVLTPCIEQIKGTNKFDITLLEIFMEKIKEFCLNKEKFYMHLLLSLYKFCEKDEEFPKILDPKPAALYFLKYLKDGYLETKSERLLKVLKEFISETKLINLEEKKKLLINEENIINNKNIEKNIDDSFNQNMDEPEQEEKENNINNVNVNDLNNGKNIYNEDGEQEENEKEEKNEMYYNNINCKNDLNNMNINDEIDEDKKEEMYKNKFKNDILNSNSHENEIKNNINNINNIALRLKQFQDKLNNIPIQSKEKETTITGSEDKKTKEDQSSLNSNEKNNNMPLLKLNDLNNKNLKDEDDDDEDDNDNKQKLDNLQKIEDSIRLMSKRLDNTLNKMNEVSQRNINPRKQNITTNSPLNNKQGIVNNLNSNINSMNISKISENNNNASMMTSESFLKNNFINFNNNNNNIQNNKEIIDELINVIRGESNKSNIFQTAKIHFQKLSSSEEKIDFIKIFRNSLENPIFLNQVPINTCTNLFDFILSILSYQILIQSNVEQIIVSLQATAEYLLAFRSLNDMFKIMLFLLKKYFPKNLNNKIEDLSLVIIKVISYLLKELLKKMNKENVIGREIICEINDLFTVTPPSTLTTATPNALFYQKIFTLLKNITDQIIHNNKTELNNIIQYLQENKIVCEDYIQYLIRLKKNC